MTGDDRQDQLEPLLERLFLGGLAPQECESLQALMATDPAAQRRYAEVVHMREGLAYLLSQAPQENGSPQSAVELAKHLPFAPPAAAQRRRSRLNDWLPSWAAAACMALVCTGVASAIAYRLGAGSHQLASSRPFEM
jgi:anti-sigma factor RsiW